MRYVLDSSVAFKWEVAESDVDKAIQLRDEAKRGLHELLAPDIFPVEVAHALTRAERQKRISTAEGWKLWLGIVADAPALQPFLPLMPKAYALSSNVRMGVYDCLYIILAEEEQCDFVTADEKLLKNLQPQFPFIKSLASIS